MLASHALALVGVPMRRVIRIVQDQRDARYSLLRGYFHGADDDTVDELRAGAPGHASRCRCGAGALGRVAQPPGAARRAACAWSACAAATAASVDPDDRSVAGGRRHAGAVRPARAAGLAEEILLRRMTHATTMTASTVSDYLQRRHIRTVPDWPAPGVQFRDITPLLQNPQGVPRADRPVRAPLHGPPARRGGRARRARLHPRLGAGLRARTGLRADPQEGQAALHDGGGNLRAGVRQCHGGDAHRRGASRATACC